MRDAAGDTKAITADALLLYVLIPWTAINLSWIVGLVVTVPLYYLLAVRQRTRRPAAAPEPVRN